MNNNPFDEENLPELPYNGNSGWSGSETSRDRALENDSKGLTKHRQAITLTLLSQSRYDGLTWRELASKTEMHHGSASGVLSALHKAGRIERLTLVRNRCKVYVLPLFVDGRSTEAYKQAKSKCCPHCGGSL